MPEKVKSTITPRLRFPEFQGAGNWEEKALRNVCERIMDGTHFSPKSKHGPRPYLTSKNIRSGQIDLSTVSFISEEEHREIYTRCPVRMLDVLLTKDGANTGNCAINPIVWEFSLLSSVAVLRGNPSQLIQDFLYQAIASERTQTIIQDSMAGQAITRITLEKLGLFTILVPSLGEQRRIADCLTSLDACFAAQRRKVEALKAHKRGLMRQLFPRRSETIPRLRFPEFRHAPEWEEKSLESLSESVSSGRDKLDAQGAFDLYGSTGVIGKTLNGSYSGKFILVARVGANAGLLNIASGNSGVTDNTLVIVAKDKRSIQFLFYCLDVFGLNRLIFGSGQPLNTGGQLKGLIFPIPSKVEQQRIADCLSSLDAEIAAESEKLDALKTHKKGLIQLLFPNPEEEL